MVPDADTIHVVGDGELSRLLDRAATAPLRLEKDGIIFRVIREEPLWSEYDPAKVRAAVKAAAGSWSDLDTDGMIADLYRARDEGSRPVDRP